MDAPDLGPPVEAQLARLRDLTDRHRIGGEPAEAERYARAALALTQARVDTDPMARVESLNALGLVCKELARYDEARSCYERALIVLEAAAPGDERNAAIATLHHNLGGIEHARGNHATGEMFARRGLELRLRSGGRDARAMAADMIALGALLDGQEKFDEAERLYDEALSILERDPAANAGEIAVALNDLGAHEAKRGRLRSAELLLGRAAEIKRGLFGETHPDLAVTLNNLAMVYKRQGDLRRAAATFGDALDVFTFRLGESHPKTTACRRNHDGCVE